MAIVFVSPRKKQTLFIFMIIGIFAVILLAIFLIIFLSKPEQASQGVIFKKPDIKIDFSVLDSEELKSLDPINPIEYQFTYKATDGLGKQATGKISAVSEEAAKEKLEKDKFTDIELQKEEIGRENPFNIYYQPSIIKNPKSK